MKVSPRKTSEKLARCDGMTVVELAVVFIFIGIFAAVSIPQLISWQRLTKFSGNAQIISASLRDARQIAMTQDSAVTVRYDDNTKQISVIGILNDLQGVESRKRLRPLAGNGLLAGDIIYGPAPTAPNNLGDNTILTNPDPATRFIDITFSPRGDAVTTTGAPANTALFFNERNSNTSFAVSVLGPGGRVRIWRFNGNIYQ